MIRARTVLALFELAPVPLMRKAPALGGIGRICGLAAALLLASCGGDASAPAASWSENHPQQYVVQTCTHGIEPPGCNRAAVARGKVVKAQERIFAFNSLPDAGAQDVGWEDSSGAPDPIQEMFDESDHPKSGCKLASRTFDKKYGFVSDYKLNCGGSAAGRYVACFKPDQTDIEACAIEP